MQKGVQAEDEETEDKSTSDEIDNTDYQKIIESLNAKITALEEENSKLKNKVEGAFGYSAKTSEPAKVNRLYDDAIDVHFHK